MPPIKYVIDLYKWHWRAKLKWIIFPSAFGFRVMIMDVLILLSIWIHAKWFLPTSPEHCVVKWFLFSVNKIIFDSFVTFAVSEYSAKWVFFRPFYIRQHGYGKLCIEFVSLYHVILTHWITLMYSIWTRWIKELKKKSTHITFNLFCYFITCPKPFKTTLQWTMRWKRIRLKLEYGWKSLSEILFAFDGFIHS